MHITWKETKAITNAVHSLHQFLPPRCFLTIQTDSTVAAVVMMKGSGKPHLDDLGRDVRGFLAERKNFLVTRHVLGIINRADRLSRTTSDRNDYAIRRSVIQNVWKQMDVQPRLDMFAADHNALLPIFWSWNKSPNAAAVDALRQTWDYNHQGLLHCNPPWPLIPRVLKKIEEDGARVMAVLPMWQWKVWWSRVHKLQVGDSFVLTGKVFQDRWGRSMPPPRWKTVVMVLDRRLTRPST